ALQRRDGLRRSHGATGIEPRPASDDPQRTCTLRRVADALAQSVHRIGCDAGHVLARADGAMCHSRQACTGTTLPGFDRRSGSNTSRSAHIVASESGEKIRSMYPTLSSPTPCSPVIVPPAATHVCMISDIAACTRFVSSASAALYGMFGCRLPSPA